MMGENVLELIRKKRSRLYEEIVEKIRKLIVEGTLAPGDQLLPERQLAEKLGVSRTAVREALTALATEGLLEITPGSGAYVKDVKIDDLIDPFATIILKEIDSIFDLLEARLVVETGAARLAAQRAERADLYDMHELVRDMENDVREGRNTDESDSQFHFSLVRSAHNPVILNLMTMLMGLMKDYYGPSRQKLVNQQKNRLLWSEQHGRVYEAIKNRDAEAAAAAVAEHLMTTIEELKKMQGLEG